jgi:proteasome accessory factor B
MADSTKFIRLFGLYERFMNHGQLTIGRMMSDYGVNRRTVNRDLLDLQEVGLRLEAREAGGHKVWMVAQRDRKISVEYNLTDLTALFMGRRLFDFLRGTLLEVSMDKVYASIERRLERTRDFTRARDLSRRVHLISEGPKQLDEVQVESLDAVLDGLLQNRRLRFDYVDARGEGRREVMLEPYTLVAFRRGLYVLGKKDGADGLRTYAVERIRNAESLRGTRFELPEGFDPEEHFASALHMQTGPPARVTLIFSRTTEPFIRIRRFHPSQQVRTLPDGRVEMTLDVPAGAHDFEIENFVLSFHENVEVVSPPSLREAVRRKLEHALGQYG